MLKLSVEFHGAEVELYCQTHTYVDVVWPATTVPCNTGGGAEKGRDVPLGATWDGRSRPD